ncbi:MAG: DUF6691 family protein [Haloferacaceae archaeon]
MSTESNAGSANRHPLFLPVVFLGGAIFGVGLAVGRMARPEIVLEFLQFRDLGLLFVMGGAAATVGATVFALRRSGRRAPLTGERYRRRLKSMDRNVLIGGGIFGVGWGLSGICPGAAYASLGIGNVVILYAIAGMFLGAYLQGLAREATTFDTEPTAAD